MPSEDEWDEMEWDWLDKDVNPDLDDGFSSSSSGGNALQGFTGGCILLIMLLGFASLCWLSMIMSH